MKTITLIAKNENGASVEFTGTSKAECLRQFKAEYSTSGWRFEYFDETGRSI